MDSHTAEARKFAERLSAMGWEFITEPAWPYSFPAVDDYAMKGVDY